MLLAGVFTVNRRKIALVTGASAGIGAAVSVALAKADYQVIGVARRLDKIRRLNEQLNDAATRIDARCVDIRREADIESLFAYIRDEYGTLDVLVNNAGLGRDASLLDGATDAWRHMFELNVIALSVCTREAVKLMEHGQRAGHVVHISSMSGHRVPTGSGGMYSATKHAVRALAEALRRELRAKQSPIRISSISPGFVETEFAEVMSGSREVARDVYSRFECLQPKDIAASVLYLLSQPQHVQIHDILMRPTEQVS